MTYQVFLSEKARRDLDGLSNKITHQILSDCARLADDPHSRRKAHQEVTRAGDYRVVFQSSGTRIDIVRVLSKPDFQKAY